MRLLLPILLLLALPAFAGALADRNGFQGIRFDDPGAWERL